jgi:hypothetical protein
LIFIISAGYISCRNHVDLDTQPKASLKSSNTVINILKTKKFGDWIFSMYRKDSLTGLASMYKDSIVFINDTFFSTRENEYRQFDFIDSLKIEFLERKNHGNNTVDYKYIFRFNGFSNKWLLEYAEKKECAAEQSVYLFTDSIQQTCSIANFSIEKISPELFANVNERLLSYKYTKKKYLDISEIQMKNMRLANIASFRNIFTVNHTEEILHDYPIDKTNVLFLNNIAYYLEQMSIAMPAIIILETVIANYPNRTVSYLNLSDALTKNNLKMKAEKIYRQYSKLLKK